MASTLSALPDDVLCHIVHNLAAQAHLDALMALVVTSTHLHHAVAAADAWEVAARALGISQSDHLTGTRGQRRRLHALQRAEALLRANGGAELFVTREALSTSIHVVLSPRIISADHSSQAWAHGTRECAHSHCGGWVGRLLSLLEPFGLVSELVGDVQCVPEASPRPSPLPLLSHRFDTRVSQARVVDGHGPLPIDEVHTVLVLCDHRPCDSSGNPLLGYCCSRAISKQAGHTQHLTTWPCTSPRCMDPASPGCLHCSKHGACAARRSIVSAAAQLSVQTTGLGFG